MWCVGFSLPWLLLLWSTGSRHAGSVVVAHRLRGMWDLPRPGLEPMSPALVDGFLTTVPPGRWQNIYTSLSGISSFSQRIPCRGFPGGTVVKNPPANAEEIGSSPCPGRSHMLRSNQARAPQLLSLHTRARKPQLQKPACLEPVLCNKRSHLMRSLHTATKSSPRSPQLERAREQQRRPNAAKNKYINK